ncbi:MAG: hypothetical protein JXB50_02370 [Spirochaetes bacterium]|nr:hypothetical protein [Spirochaetota bacterium]
MKKIFIFLTLFILLFSSCPTYYEFLGLITIENKTDFDIKVDIYYKRNIYYQDGQTKDSNKHEDMTIAPGDSESVTVTWAQTFKMVYNESESDDIHVIAIKLLEPVKVILDKEYKLIERDKLTIYVERAN